ncbi:hypothetical protein PENTCL1PPCAC_29753, partial [Pristionchus entomophagus]
FPDHRGCVSEPSVATGRSSGRIFIAIFVPALITCIGYFWFSMAQPDVSNAAWRQYTMKLDFNSFWQEEDEELRMIGKFISCTHDGVLAIILHNEEQRQHLFLFNIHTRVEINRWELPYLFELRYLSSIDSSTIVMVGNRFIFEERMERKEPRVFAIILTSDDGFRTLKDTEISLAKSPSTPTRYPDVCVSIGQRGFVFTMRELERMFKIGTTLEFFVVPFSELCRSAASTEENKSVTAIPVGSMPGTGEERFVVIPYGRTSFAVLKGDNGNNRIDVYDIPSRQIPRSIPVAWTFPTTFPPAVVHVLPSDCRRKALMQLITGEKLILDLETGGVESAHPFIPTENQAEDRRELNLPLHIPGAMSRSERRHAGYDSNDEDEHEEDDTIETPVVDAVYLTAGRVTVDESIVGWFATDLMEDCKIYCYFNAHSKTIYINMQSDEYDDDEAVTLLRLPINKVHSLSTLAADAVNRLLSKAIRARITKYVNPKTTAEFVKAIISMC